MTNKKQAMIDAFKEKEQIEEQEFSLIRRADDAEGKIVELQEEAEELKKKRPKLLADCKDISKINRRLKEIEEEIEIQKDTIIGVTEKRENMNDVIREAEYNTQDAFKSYVKVFLDKLEKEYMNLAPKLAEILTEYITLENMYHGHDFNYVHKIDYDGIRFLPNLKDGKNPFFQYKTFEIYKNNAQRLQEKYDIPDYQVHKIR